MQHYSSFLYHYPDKFQTDYMLDIYVILQLLQYCVGKPVSNATFQISVYLC